VANGDGSLSVSVRGLREVQRALDKLPREAQNAAQRQMGLLAGRLTQRVRAAARADSKPAARAATTVRSRAEGLTVTVTAGPHDLLFLSEFGMNRHTGWYGKPRYRRSKEPNAPHRHAGKGSYWFFETVDNSRADVDAAATAIGEQIIANWGA
jgi:hypothetical protein